MATNTVRSVVIFSVIAIGFIGLTAGGMLFMKSRNHTLATAQSGQPAQKQDQQDAAKQEAAKKEEEKKTTEAAKNDDKKNESVAANNNSASQTPAPDNKPAEQPAAAATPTAVPATGPSLPGMIATMVLMMAAAFFGSQLLRVRAAYRRHLEG